MGQVDYASLTSQSLPGRLSGVEAVCSRLGGDPQAWSVDEVGDGNLNLVFIVRGDKGSIIVKQALPYVRLVGDSWPLPLYRAFYEYHALMRQAARDPGTVPEVYFFDETQALIVMEFLTDHVILRKMLINGQKVEGLGDFCGKHCARMAFRGSELFMKSSEKKADVRLFAGNVEIPAITEGLVFTDPYYDAAMNHHTSGLEPIISEMRANADLKGQVQAMLVKFSSNTETMIHGDLHSGSIMATEHQIRVIDPEFAQYGPMSVDIGMLTANFLMAFFSQPAHRDIDLAGYQDWILDVVKSCFSSFEAEFRHLWATERTGMLYPKTLFEDQGQSSALACNDVLAGIWLDALRFCGIEMHRRCLSLAHNADFEKVADIALRAKLEARNLKMGTELIMNADDIANATDLAKLANAYNAKDFL
jgi:5-methylthioribose kinase